MSHFLVTATEQEIFDAAYMGLKSQGFEKSSDGASCFYADGQENHCAIGWACVLSKSTMPREETSVQDFSFWESIGEYKNDVLKSRQLFLFYLQCAHDNAKSPAAMRSYLEEFAAEHNLTVPSFDVSRLVLEPA